MAGETSTVISPELQAFYEKHNIQNIESSLLSTSSVRFIRLNPRYDADETLELLKQELDGKPVTGIPWLDGSFNFYAISGGFKLAQSSCFRSGRVYGMDVSSGAAVAALLSSVYDVAAGKQKGNPQAKRTNLRVLDLCCAPGLKLCMISDLIPDNSSTIIGVDVSMPRISLCKNIVKKYHVDPDTLGNPTEHANIRLYCADGVTFGTQDTEQAALVFDSDIAQDDQKRAGKRKRMNKSARARERKRLKLIQSQDNDELLFDRVLVDAECSTDGSLKHVQHQLKKQKVAVSNEQLTDTNKLESLVRLQRGLIASGFRLLKPGGIMIYSTCSLSENQNEGVVNWLLSGETTAHIIPVDFDASKEHEFIAGGSVDGTVRFRPHHQSGGGFFLAKIGKKG